MHTYSLTRHPHAAPSGNPQGQAVIPTFFLTSALASVVGAICGIGGGIIIKPALDMFDMAGVETVNFLSNCTVLAMSAYSIGKSLLSRSGGLDVRIATPLALGAIVGGAAAKPAFTRLMAYAGNPNIMGALQAACLLMLTFGTFLYMLFKSRIRTRKTDGVPAGAAIGLALGFVSSFLGIGGGPINLVLLFYFYSMSSKDAAKVSLYIILFSQIANLAAVVAAGAAPAHETAVLAWMVAGGITGGIVGRAINKRIDHAAVDRLFTVLMIVIMGICLYNVHRFWAAG